MPPTDPSHPQPIQDQLRGFVARTFRGGDEAGLEPDTPLVSSGIVDSVGVMELVDFLERTFSVSVPPGDVVLEHFDSLRRLGEYVLRGQGHGQEATGVGGSGVGGPNVLRGTLGGALAD